MNQGMKRQPMAVYRIREILTVAQKDSHDVDQLRSDDLCGDSLSTSFIGHSAVINDNAEGLQSSAVGYEDGLPVREFLSKHHNTEYSEVNNLPEAGENFTKKL